MDPNFGVDALKPLSREFLGKMLTSFFRKILQEKLGLQSSVFNSADMNTAIVVTEINTTTNEKKRQKELDTILNKINLEASSFMNDYIEQEMGEPCTKYYRDQNLYESKIDENRLILTWY
ncbi:MAG: hypothetical protein H8E98_01590 [Bacteroidetes bacterium]|nr:hypothetical protein [Bacteroidota bacterium]